MTKKVMLNCNMDDSAKGIHEMILGRYLFTDLRLKLEFYDHVIEADDGSFKGSTAPMVDMGAS